MTLAFGTIIKCQAYWNYYLVPQGSSASANEAPPSAPSLRSLFALPDDMRTTAVAGRSVSRFVIQA